MARATSGTRAASPATRPTPTATSASRRPSRTTRTSRSSRAPRASHTDWDPAKATQLANDFISSGEYDDVQGIWTSGMDSQVVDAIKAAGKPYVPIVGADLGAFVGQLLDPTDIRASTGAAVTNTAAVGGAGVNLALKLLNGETVETAADGRPAEHGPAQAGPRRQRHATPARRCSSRGRSTVSTRSGRSVSRSRATPRTPRAGRRLQGPGRVTSPGSSHRAGMPASPASPRRHYPEDR